MGWAAQAGFVSTSKRRRAPRRVAITVKVRVRQRELALHRRERLRAAEAARAANSCAARPKALGGGGFVPDQLLQAGQRIEEEVRLDLRLQDAKLGHADLAGEVRHRDLLLGLGQAQLQRALLAPAPPAQRQMHE